MRNISKGDVVELLEPYIGSHCTIPSGSAFRVVDTNVICNVVTIQVSPNRYGENFNGWHFDRYGTSGEMFWNIPFDSLKKKYWRMDV